MSFPASSSTCARVIPMRSDAAAVLDRDDDVDVPALRDGLVELGDLVALRQVGVEVLLAVELGPAADAGVETEAELHRLADHRLGEDGVRARVAHAGGAAVRVGLVAVHRGAPAERLGPAVELDVGLDADHRLELHLGVRARLGRVGGGFLLGLRACRDG